MRSDAVLVDRWRSLLTSYNAVAGHLERELHDRHGLTMSEYEKRRMQDLAADMYLSQSALSRAVARLEKEGLVARTLCEADRRGVYVTPTKAGIRRHHEARKTHLAVLAEHFRADPVDA
jgi:DNA-binding MarR family transcriptional regulator